MSAVAASMQYIYTLKSVLSEETVAEGEQLKRVTIYTDGACTGNPGPGGFGVVLSYGEKRRELSGGFRRTTNNRMEIMAAITGLEALKYPCIVTLYTDSQYLVNSIEKGWVRGWKAKGWRKADGKMAVNVDLWERILPLLQMHRVSFVWVKGHAETEENNVCDRLAVAAAHEPGLPADTGYERSA
jgi:ribonuclease HI